MKVEDASANGWENIQQHSLHIMPFVIMGIQFIRNLSRPSTASHTNDLLTKNQGFYCYSITHIRKFVRAHTNLLDLGRQWQP